ncbi:amino acid kinase, partial [Candidatus Bathyarchaeota archaeon]|nr:amino acid kinase [Candidatus Bathyarchaeota archaeon]
MDTTVIKVGGSLSQNPQSLRALCVKLSEIAKKHALVLVPGGGEFADCVRDFDKRFSLSSSVVHRMAILGMDQYGLLLSDLAPDCSVVDKLEDAKRLSGTGRLVVFLPSRFL